jgi:hypothetical protein
MGPLRRGGEVLRRGGEARRWLRALCLFARRWMWRLGLVVRAVLVLLVRTVLCVALGLESLRGSLDERLSMTILLLELPPLLSATLL